MKSPKILMLGWEFPPTIHGGLGIACLGMAKALRKSVDLSIILPRTDSSFNLPGVDLIGLNHLNERELEAIKRFDGLDSLHEITQSPLDLNPYPDAPTHCDPHTAKPVATEATEGKRGLADSDLNLFQDEGTLYGKNLNAKVIAFAKAAAAIARDRDFDIVHAHDWMTFLAGLEIKRQTGKPLVVHIHSLSYDRAGAEARGWIYDIERQAMHEADKVIPVSHYTGRICRDHHEVPTEKIFPVHNGSEPVKPYRKEKPFPEKMVLFLGRLTGQKGPHFFLEIAAKVLEQTRDVRFVIAGIGDQLYDLIEHAVSRNIADHLHFTGFRNRDQINDLFAMTDVYCMPSVSDPFGLSALEAAQFGIPAVISAQSGIAEVLTKSRKADYWDIDLMAQHIVDLISDKEAHQAAAQASLQEQKNGTWDRAAEALLPIYQSCLPRS